MYCIQEPQQIKQESEEIHLGFANTAASCYAAKCLEELI